MKHHTIAWLLGSAALLGATGGAQAQTIYRIVGADGKVTFSDKPPATAEQGKLAGTGVGANSAAAGSTLPFELKKIVAKYPVTLYASAKCAPCDVGRAALVARGVPYSERTVGDTPEDSDYLKRLTGDSSLPFLSIGGQRLKGFSSSEWTQYLDAAGYPATSQLPAAYKNPAPTPLVPAQKAAAPAAKAEEKPEAPTPIDPRQTPAVNPANPAGITF